MKLLEDLIVGGIAGFALAFLLIYGMIRSNEVECFEWYDRAVTEDELADWSYWCGTPRPEGGCDIYHDGNRLTVTGVCPLTEDL